MYLVKVHPALEPLQLWALGKAVGMKPLIVRTATHFLAFLDAKLTITANCSLCLAGLLKPVGSHELRSVQQIISWCNKVFSASRDNSWYYATVEASSNGNGTCMFNLLVKRWYAQLLLSGGDSDFQKWLTRVSLMSLFS